MSLSSCRTSPALFPLVACLLALGACMGPGQPSAPPLPPIEKAAPLTLADTDLVRVLGEMDLTQIALAKIAQTHAARSDIATLGTTIAKDMAGNQDRLAKIVAAHAIALPSAPAEADRTVIARMGRLHGAAFDRSYVRYLSRDHARMQPILANGIATAKNPDLIKLAGDSWSMLAAYDAQLK